MNAGGLVEMHAHILPGMDDGSKSVEMSIEMLHRLAEMGVAEVCATSHYYAGQNSVTMYLERRAMALEQLREAVGAQDDLPCILPAAEVAYFRGVEEHSYVYFVHSYYLEAADPSIVTATTEYGTLIHASVEKGNIFACQFHPEKSSRVGMKILQNFIEITQEFREKDKQGGRGYAYQKSNSLAGCEGWQSSKRCEFCEFPGCRRSVGGSICL